MLGSASISSAVSSRFCNQAQNQLKPSISTLPIITLVVLTVLQPTTAYAYLDPATGSFILQMLVASFLAAWLYVRIAWTSTKLFFARLFSNEPAAEEKADADNNDQGDETK